VKEGEEEDVRRVSLDAGGEGERLCMLLEADAEDEEEDDAEEIERGLLDDI